MFLKFIEKLVNTIVIVTFLMCSVVPTQADGTQFEIFPEKEAMFGMCRLKRIKKKTKRLVKSIEQYKNGKKTVEEVTLEIASLKRTANKAFKKNYKVNQIMQMANEKIDNFMQSLINESPNHMKNYFEMSFDNEEKIIHLCNLQNSCESIHLFISRLKEYEDNDWSDQALRKELLNLKKNRHINGSINMSSGDHSTQESKILFAYVSIFCGCLLCIIPTPITRAAGTSLISGGVYVLCESEWVDLDENNKNNQNEDN